MAAAALALIVANSPASDLYDQLFKVRISLGIAPVALEKSLLHWINDGLMAVFFFLVGLEIKRELLVGALSSRKTAALPAIGAVGGMAIPALIYCILNWHDDDALHGWAIPAATDIAFAVGVIALLGSRVPPSLKIFILALAIIDDLGAIIIIALFYSHDLSLVALVLAGAGGISLLVLNRLGVKVIWPFLAVGLFVWLCVLKSGIHATLAGVITALAIPLASGQEGRAGPLERMEHALAPWVSFGILPMFALANAGVSLAGVGLGQLTQSIPLGIALGLFVGKAFGIFGVSWAAIRLGAADMPEAASYAQLFGVSMLGGIGFTMSLFIGMLAFPDPDYATQIKIGVLTGSIASAALGYLLLRSLGAARALPATG
jgi:Na+:H+ antiporter, NhaA family